MSMASTETSPQLASAPDSRFRFTLISILWFGALLFAAYWPVLTRLFNQWMNDEDMGHGLFVPVIASYIAWQRRDKVLAAAAKGGSWLGLVVVLYGALQLLVATLGAELFLARTAFIISLTGALMLLGGLATIRALAFPLFLLLFMVPIPAIIYNQITLPLQLFASSVAETVLNLIGIPVLREGNILELPSQRLSVVEACSGIRSLLSLSFLSLVYAYFFDEKKWMRAVLLVAAIPIAIITNASRVTITGILSEYKREWADGFFHTAEGWIMFMVALAALVITHRVINAVYHRVRGK